MRSDKWFDVVAIATLFFLAIIGTGNLHSQAAEVVPAAPAAEAVEANPYRAIWEKASTEEKEIFVQILALEAQGEPYEGIKAAAEVIFNRIVSEQWPDTIVGVLSQKGQFAAWKYRHDPYNRPTVEEYRAVDDVVMAGPSVLPSDYVYFATYKANGRDFVRIGHHYFSR